MNHLTTKPKKLNKKQRTCIDYWTESGSETFGNLYQSAIKAGFRPSYALNLSHLRPEWLSDTIGLIQLERNHITQGIQAIATSANNSKSPDDTRLKALEILAKIAGMIDNKQGNTINIVQPILNGESVKSTQSQDLRPKPDEIIEGEVVETE